MDTTATKRKRPPTFVHLPANKAQKLRRDWIETRKLKSKWRAQKRREGLVKPRSDRESDGEERTAAADPHDDGQDDDEGEDSSGHDSENSDEEGQDGDNLDKEREDAPPQTLSHALRRSRGHLLKTARGRGQEHLAQAPSRGQSSRGQKPSRGQHLSRDHHPSRASTHRPHPDEPPAPEPTLRERARAAYHPDALHTHKAGRGGRGGGGETGRGGRGGERGRGGEWRRGGRSGRGQPNMALRMEVMLEKIKRDYA
ncbi:hypothetical protein HDZ31DRAFT_60602 [Schizophyllum fasciatum]